MVEFRTLTSNFPYLIHHGRANAIDLSEEGQPVPAYPPSLIKIPKPYLVLKWDVEPQAYTVVADWIRTTLYIPKDHEADDSILDVPTYSGQGGRGHYTVRFPQGDNTAPTREHSPLWTDFIEPSWKTAPGVRFTLTMEDLEEERANDEWPKSRSEVRFDDPGFEVVTPTPIPFRLATEVLGTTRLLALIEIRRKGRLRLYCRTYRVVNEDCAIASAGFGPEAHELDVLRGWRDDTLLQNGVGRAFARGYYRVAAPIARVLERTGAGRAVTRTALRPLVYALDRGVDDEVRENEEES